MCIVIDTNTFASIFDPKSSDHLDFRPILEWICRGNGKIVFGGTKYKEELRATQKYLRLFRQLQSARKTVEISDEDVDREQERIKRVINHRDFDDSHIIAIISISRCKLICSKDSRAYPFFKNRDLYLRSVKRPKIYSGLANSDLLCEQNIAQCCKPTSRSTELLFLLKDPG